jgi:hypothetical protein
VIEDVPADSLAINRAELRVKEAGVALPEMKRGPKSRKTKARRRYVELLAFSVKNRAYIVEALRRLEYRGYDSAGIATLENGAIERRRAPANCAPGMPA